MRVIVFNVDGTLSIANGPIPVKALRTLKKDRTVILGVVGNWQRFANRVPDWSKLISLMGPTAGAKPAFLQQIKQSVKAQSFQIIGNAPEDQQAAAAAGWTFINAAQWRKKKGPAKPAARPPSKPARRPGR